MLGVGVGSYDSSGPMGWLMVLRVCVRPGVWVLAVCLCVCTHFL